MMAMMMTIMMIFHVFVYLCVNSFWTSISGGSRLAVWRANIAPFPPSSFLPLLSFPPPLPFISLSLPSQIQLKGLGRGLHVVRSPSRAVNAFLVHFEAQKPLRGLGRCLCSKLPIDSGKCIFSIFWGTETCLAVTVLCGQNVNGKWKRTYIFNCDFAELLQFGRGTTPSS